METRHEDGLFLISDARIREEVLWMAQVRHVFSRAFFRMRRDTIMKLI